MSLFGKVLAFLNILAVGAFAYFGMKSYSQRAKWSYAAFRYELAIKGLPVDKSETDENNALRYKKITKSLQSELGITVQTLEEAAEQLVSQTKSTWASAGKDELKTQILVYLHFAETARHRESLLTLYAYLDNPAVASSAAERDFLEKMKTSLPSDLSTRLTRYKSLDQEAKRREIGDVDVAVMELFLPKPQQGQAPPDPFESGYYRKMVRILGGRETSRALSKKAQILVDITNQLRDQVRPLIQSGFVAQHDDLVEQIRRRELRWRELLSQVATKEEQAKVKRQRADKQIAIVAKKTKELADAQVVSQNLLDALAKEQKRLFDTLIELRNINRRNQELEKRIRELESQLP